METMADDFNQALLTELECPVCMEYMLPPIVFCENGHNVCPECRPKLDECPTCRRGFVNIRNLALENVTRKVDYPCKNRIFGCKDTFPSDSIRKHQSGCSYSPYKCFLYTVKECTWSGPLNLLKKHLLNDHGEDFKEQTGPTSLIINTDSSELEGCKAMFAFDQIFYINIQRIGGYYYIAVRYAGPRERASEFGYRITFKKADSLDEITVCNTARSISEQINDIFESGNCFKFPIGLLKKFKVQEANLPYKLEIFQGDPSE